MNLIISLVIVNVFAVGMSYAAGNGWFIILTLVSLIFALFALVRSMEREEQ
jgi:hypothetical protein